MTDIEAIKSALDSLSVSGMDKQALIDCKRLLNINLDALIDHFRSWGVVDRKIAGDELHYKIQINKIESYLGDQKLLYNCVNRS